MHATTFPIFLFRPLPAAGEREREESEKSGGGGEDKLFEYKGCEATSDCIGLGELHILMLADRAHSEGARSMARSKGYATHLTKN